LGGDDGYGNYSRLSYQYIFTPTADTSEWLEATNVQFTGIPAANPAIFKVRARDLSDNVSGGIRLLSQSGPLIFYISTISSGPMTWVISTS
jgi:hypothetical protein